MTVQIPHEYGPTNYHAIPMFLSHKLKNVGHWACPVGHFLSLNSGGKSLNWLLHFRRIFPSSASYMPGWNTFITGLFTLMCIDPTNYTRCQINRVSYIICQQFNLILSGTLLVIQQLAKYM